MSLIFRGGVIQMSERGVIDVLHVEDDPGYALIVRKSFAQASRNSRFHAVTDGRQALRFLRRAGAHAGAPRPGLIILDLNLPGLHGLEVLAEIKADPDLMIIPVVILSSSRNPGDIRRGYELHANAYVVKPEDMDGFDDGDQGNRRVLHRPDRASAARVTAEPARRHVPVLPGAWQVQLCGRGS